MDDLPGMNAADEANTPAMIKPIARRAGEVFAYELVGVGHAGT
jgi:hypothetical protein